LAEGGSNRVLLVYENLKEHTRAYNLVTETILSELYSNQNLRGQLSLAPSKLLGDLSNSCGYRTNESNLTVVVVNK
jgi:hypothetical protein